ncbi:MAG TPA: hypothetical protein VFL93_13710 [Longimicrobiaceae bacterium]|nr:hypothetical protein [Longimicrobiaceae bacterium]
MRHLSGWIPLVLLLSGCTSAPVPPPSPAPPPAPTPPPPALVWTARPDVVLRRDSSSLRLPRPFTRLDVRGADSASFVVRCLVCADTALARVDTAEVIFRPLPPDSAARGSLAEFALALRTAALGHSWVALHDLMTPDFFYSFRGADGRDNALRAWDWSDGKALDEVPVLLDRGLGTAPDGIWAAPPEYLAVTSYAGTRLGIRRSDDGRWRWIFMVSGER